jgi:hypothetical protein
MLFFQKRVTERIFSAIPEPKEKNGFICYQRPKPSPVLGKSTRLDSTVAESSRVDLDVLKIWVESRRVESDPLPSRVDPSLTQETRLC